MAATLITTDYAYGDVVYLATDTDQTPRIVTAILVRDTHVTFELSSGTATSWHSAVEISPVKNVLV